MLSCFDVCAPVAGVAVRIVVGGVVRFTETVDVVFGLTAHTEQAEFAKPCTATAGEAEQSEDTGRAEHCGLTDACDVLADIDGVVGRKGSFLHTEKVAKGDAAGQGMTDGKRGTWAIL